MWTMQSHTLVPLTKLTSITSKFQWTQVEPDAFSEINWIMAHDNLSTYPGFNVTLKSHTNASVFQLGLFIRNKGKPIVFYSIKLTSDQQQYTVTEKELLSIVET